MTETLFEELKRYVRFEAADQTCLRAFGPVAAPHFAAVADVFYARVVEHEEARAVFSGPDQIERLKHSLREWMRLLFEGPWDEAYFQRRLRIGRVHVQIALPQRYMMAAMNVVRTALIDVVARHPANDSVQLRLAIHKLLDIELAIMLESYREDYVAHVQREERLERDDLQRQLALSEARYEEIVEKAEALIATFDREGRLLWFNAKCERLTGLSRADARGLVWLDLFVPAADHAAVRARLSSLSSGEAAAAYEGAIPVIESGQCRVRWHFTTLPSRAEPALCAIGIDVSNEHDLGVRTRRAERLAALGTMAAGLAHEIRNPLNAAHLQLTLADRKLSREPIDLDGARAAVRVADAEMRRLGLLVQDFLEFARPQPLRLAPTDLQKTLEVTTALLEPEAQARGVALRLAPHGAVTVEVDEEKIKQVLLNLVRNAIEATGSSGHVDLQLSRKESQVEIVVRDTGSGLDADAPIFEPFYTTKEHGTGLGLAIVHRIVMDHGGAVGVRSAPGDTQFSVTLPVAHA